MVFTVGVGFTVMSNEPAAPVHPLAVGVIVTVAVTGEVVLFVAVNGFISEVPLAARPILVVLFVQAYVVPDTGLVKFIAAVLVPLQTV